MGFDFSSEFLILYVYDLVHQCSTAKVILVCFVISALASQKLFGRYGDGLHLFLFVI
jgi:hypothetical protein